MAPVQKIELLGESHAITLPQLLVLREELLQAVGTTSGRSPHLRLRAASAVVGLCTRIGRKSNVDYGKCGYDALAYGGQIYSWLRAQGAPAEAILVAANAILPSLLEALGPAAAEVQEAMGNSAGGEGR